jgi:hydrogenase maturation protease
MKTLVIGYGNTLRGDDGVGSLVAEQVATWSLPDVRSHSIHQLTPELAAEIAQAEQIFFIDASIYSANQPQSPPTVGSHFPGRVPRYQENGADLGGDCNPVPTPPFPHPRIKRLFPTTLPNSLDHTWSPNILLYLAKTLYDAEPIAYHILIPAMQFDYGETLSAIARNGTDWVIAKLASELRPDFVHSLEKSIAGDPAKWTFHQSHTAMIRSPPDCPLADKTSIPRHW